MYNVDKLVLISVISTLGKHLKYRKASIYICIKMDLSIKVNGLEYLV